MSGEQLRFGGDGGPGSERAVAMVLGRTSVQTSFRKPIGRATETMKFASFGRIATVAPSRRSRAEAKPARPRSCARPALRPLAAAGSQYALRPVSASEDIF